MAMYFHVFGTKRCKFCTKATKLLKKKDMKHVVSYLDDCPEVLDELKSSVEWKTVPIILEVLDDKSVFIGGYTELEGYINGSTEKKEKNRGEGTESLRSDSM